MQNNIAKKISLKHWYIEGIFPWLENFRRLNKDFEYLFAWKQSIIYIASTKPYKQNL